MTTNMSPIQTFDNGEIQPLLASYEPDAEEDTERAISAFGMITVLRVALAAALRVIEVCGLRIGDLDLKSNSFPTIRIKGRNGHTREIPLPTVMGPMLRVYLDELHQHGFDVGEDAPLFPGRDGTAIKGHVLRERWRRDLKAAGLPDMEFHALRRTAAVQLFDATANGDRRLVDKLLGHNGVSAAHYDNVSMVQLAALQDEAWSSHPVLAGVRGISDESDDDLLLDRDEVQLRAGMGITYLFAAISEGNFPKPITRSDGEWPTWRASDVELWIAGGGNEGVSR